jgi:hypothetical protein
VAHWRRNRANNSGTSSLTSIQERRPSSSPCPQISLPLLENESQGDFFSQHSPILSSSSLLSAHSSSSRRTSLLTISHCDLTSVHAQNTFPLGHKKPNFSKVVTYNAPRKVSLLRPAVFEPYSVCKMKSSEVEAGTLEGLIEHLLHHPDGEPPMSFYIALKLLTYLCL